MNSTRDIVVRYGEIGIKGKNRGDFEKALASNIKHALKGFVHGPVERPRGRVVVREVENPEQALQMMTKVPGITSASAAQRTEVDMDAMARAATGLMEEVLLNYGGDGTITFKVETVRSFKEFPRTSMEISAELGKAVIERLPRLKAKMKNPEIRLSVEVRSRETLLSTMHVQGPGGLPTGTMGRIMVLLSGGIDSPVAAYMAMKRGARADFINFHSYPFIPQASLDKIVALVKALNVYQHRACLYVVPFADIQVAIKNNCPEELRTILYRRMMMRLANKAAADSGALALVTGESLGQVASQTLENIRCISEPAQLPVLRPLIGFDKVETVEIADRIGTYDISVQPYPDSCTVFMPRHPKIRAEIADLEAAEAKLDMEGMVIAAFDKVDKVIIKD